MNGIRAAFFGLCSLAGMTCFLAVVGGLITEVAGQELTKWCKAYAPVGIAKNDSSGTGGAEPTKIKYGKAVGADELGVKEALGWYGDVIFRPGFARNAQVMNFYRISDLGQESIATLVEYMSNVEGQEKPFFAVAASPDALVSTGVSDAYLHRSDFDFLLTPVKWNQGAAKSLRSAVEGDRFVGDERNLAHFAAYTVLNGVNYDPNSNRCNPPAVVPDTWQDFSGIPEDALSGFYIAVNFEPMGRAFKKLEGKKVLTHRWLWPSVD